MILSEKILPESRVSEPSAKGCANMMPHRHRRTTLPKRGMRAYPPMAEGLAQKEYEPATQMARTGHKRAAFAGFDLGNTETLNCLRPDGREGDLDQDISAGQPQGCHCQEI